MVTEGEIKWEENQGIKKWVRVRRTLEESKGKRKLNRKSKRNI